MIDYDYLHHVTDEHTFKNEHLFYRFRDDENTDKEDREMSVAKVRQSCNIGKEGYVIKKMFYKEEKGTSFIRVFIYLFYN